MSRAAAVLVTSLLIFVSPAAAGASTGAWRTITFSHTVQAADRAALDRAGAQAVHPAGARSYVAFLDRAAAQRLAAVRGVAVRRVAVADKIDRRTLRPGARLAQVVRFHRGQRVTQMAALDAARTPLALARRADVLSVDAGPQGLRLDDEGGTQLVAGNHTNGTPVPGYLDWLGATGIDGKGVRVAIVDSGVDPDHPDLDDRVVAEINYDTAPNPAGDVDEIGHGTHVAGIVAGHPDTETALAFRDTAGFLYGQGVAPEAELININGLGVDSTADSSLHRANIPNYAKDSVRNGAVAWNASWHTGEGAGTGYNETTRTTDSLVRDADPETPGEQPLIMVFSAGNAGSGEQTLTVPHEAKNIIAVASSKGQRAGDTNEISSFSSRGPAADGRIMPLVAAPGEVISSARSKPMGGLCFEPADVSPIHSTCSGTSMAAPHVAGSVALITQWWRTANGGATQSPAMTRALLVNSATDLGERDVPNNNEGWGRVNLGELFTPANAAARIAQDQKQVLTNPGEERTFAVEPVDPNKPLRVTLAWTDVPGAAAKNETEAKRPSIVNDLDLSVTSARGFGYFGNRFQAGRSVSGGTADRLNTVENVLLDSAPNGPYTVTVKANALPGDGVPGAGDTTDQDFALVVSNARIVTSSQPAQLPAPVVKPAALGLAKFAKKGRFTVLKKLSVADVPAGSTVTLTCTGKGCPKKGYKRTFKTAAKNLDLTRVLRRAKLRKGAKITLRLNTPGTAPRVSTWKVGAKPGKVSAKLG